MSDIFKYLEEQEEKVRIKIILARENNNSRAEAYYMGKLSVIVDLQNIWQEPIHLKFEN